MTPRDHSNYNLRFNRSLREAGILGPLAPVEDDSFGRWVLQFAAAVLAGCVVYVGLVWVMSLQ